VNPYTQKPLAENEYLGYAGSEENHPGMSRVPPPGWWNPSDPHYERRNYYVDDNGRTIVREPGYYNPGAPMDTGRGNAREQRYSPGSDTWGASAERRMSEPGITPWGPGEKPSAPGSFPGSGGAGAGAQTPQGIDLARLLLTGGSEASAGAGEFGGAGPGGMSDELIAFLKALLGRVPGGSPSLPPYA